MRKAEQSCCALQGTALHQIISSRGGSGLANPSGVFEQGYHTEEAVAAYRPMAVGKLVSPWVNHYQDKTLGQGGSPHLTPGCGLDSS